MSTPQAASLPKAAPASPFWQTRHADFDVKNWAKLRPTGKTAVTITQQSMAEVIAIVWGDDDAQAEANAALIVHAANSHDAVVEALQGMLDLHANTCEPTDFHCKEAVAARAALKAARGEP